MVDVKVVTRVDRSGTYDTEGRQLPDIDPLKRLAESGGPGLTLCPCTLIQKEFNVSTNALHQFADRYDRRHENVGRIVVGGRRYLTGDQMEAAIKHYRLNDIGRTHVSVGRMLEDMGRDKAEQVFGAGASQTVQGWLHDVFGENPRERMNVFGVEVVRHKPRSDICFYLPREFVEDEDRLKPWARKLYWQARRMRLPRQYRQHTFLAELGEQLGLSRKSIQVYVAGKDPDFGTILDAGSEKPIERGKGEKGSNPFIFSPQEADDIRGHFRRRNRLDRGFFNLVEFADAVGIPKKAFRLWVNENTEDGTKPLFGVAVEKTPTGIRVARDALTDEQYAQLRRRPRSKSKLSELEGLLVENAREYRPEPKRVELTHGEVAVEQSLADSELVGRGLPDESKARVDRLVEHYKSSPPDFEYLEASMDLLARQTGVDAGLFWDYLMGKARKTHRMKWDAWRRQLGGEYKRKFGREMPD